MSLSILLVSSHESILFAVSDYFRQQGYEVGCSADPETASNLADQNFYDLFLLDVPLERQARERYFRSVPSLRRSSIRSKVVMLSADRSRRDLKRAQALGVDALFEKPKKLSELAAAVASLLSLHRAAS